MKENFNEALQLVLKHEGGFVNHPADPGGMTNLGVTKKVWEAYIGHSVGEIEMRALTPEKVAPLYKKMYWDRCMCDDLPSGVDYAVFDFAVNAGVGRSSRVLQGAVGAVQDGVIGVNTIEKAKAMPAQELLNKFSEAKETFYRSLPTFSTFGKGWLSRVASVQIEATHMIA
jgi:lysozyme family protein